MKINKYIATVALSSVLLTSCLKDFEEVNIL